MMHRIRSALERTATKILAIALGIIFLFLLSLFLFFFPFVENEIFESRKMTAMKLVETAHAIVADWAEKAESGTITHEAARQKAKSAIRAMRFTNRGYFWINDTTRPLPHMIVHPAMPELEGRIMDDPVFNTARKMQMGVNGKEVTFSDTDISFFKVIARVVEQAGEGFVTYEWFRPTSDGVSEKLYPKTSYVKLFEPWGWVIGTGIYIDDVYQHMAQLKRAVMIVALGILFIALLVTLLMMRTITRPIHNLVGFANAVSLGHLKTPVKGRFTGEMRALKDALVKMVAELESRMRESENRAREAMAARQALRKSEEKYRLMFENAPLGVLHFDENGAIAACNDIFVNIIGSTREALIGLKMLELPDKRLVAAVSEALAGRTGTYEGEYHSVTADKVTPVRGLFAPFAEGGGEASGGVGIIEDISERKQAEDALRKSEEKYRLLVENAQEAIFVAQDGKFRFVNVQTCELTGYGSEDLLHAPFQSFIHEQDQQLVLDRHYRRMQGLSPEPVYTFRVLHRSGAVRWTELKSVAIEWEGRPATLNFLSDVTEKRQAEAVREKLQRQLRQAQKMEALGTLTGGVAHDFNNILSIIMGYTELVQSEIPEYHPASKGLNEIKTASLRARDVIRQLLTFSRKDEEAQTVQDIGLIIKEGMRMMHSTIPASIEIREQISRDLPRVAANPTQIHQLIVNLCKNAADAMLEKGGTLAVTLEGAALSEIPPELDPELAPGEYVRLTVGDTGCGISPEQLERIFDPYFTTKAVDKGTGLGLSVVLGIVKSHGGGIRVNSRPGEGTRFEIFFPVASEAAAEPEAPVHETLPTGTERILFLDDETSVVDLNKLRLEKLGYEVAIATDPETALRMIREAPGAFDLVITDMTMPKMTGDDLSREILNIRPGMKIILCTGYSEKMSEERARGIGIARYIEKPVDMATLANAARAVLDEKRPGRSS